MHRKDADPSSLTGQPADTPGHMARLELLPLSVAEIRDGRRNLIDYLLAGNFSWQTLPSATTRRSPSQPSREEIARRILLGGYPEVQLMGRRARSVWFRSYTEGRFFKDFETLYTARGDYHSRLRALAPYLAGRSGNLLKHAEWADDEVGLYHFRDKRKREVDIVLERPDGRVVGVEVKASATVRRTDFNGLVALAELAGTAFEHGVLLYTGSQVLPFRQGSVRLHALPLGIVTGAGR